jgi:hypothetical protein
MSFLKNLSYQAEPFFVDREKLFVVEERLWKSDFWGPEAPGAYRNILVNA